MTKEEALQTLTDTIENDLKHADYQHVCNLSKLYNQFITGNKVESLLKRFNPREDETMFEQRKRLTIPITPAVASSIKKPFQKVPRITPITRKIASKNEKDSTAVTEIEQRIANFYGGDNNVGGLDYFLQNRFVDLSFVDPNSWLVIEFDAFDNLTEKPTPRPFEVPCDKAVNFLVRNNVVQWLIVADDCCFYEREAGLRKKCPGKKYTIYAENDAWVLHQVSNDDQKRDIDGLVPSGNMTEIQTLKNDLTFLAVHYDYKWGRVPAFRVGYIRDIETDGRTYVNPFHDALCYFHKSIKQVSEFDLSTCLHTFPQKVIRITNTCPGEKGQKCIKGRLTDGKACGTCKGTGKPIHTSGQSIIEVELPDDPKEDGIVPLTDFIYYVPLPIELLKFQKEVVDECKVDCHQAVFNSTALLRKTSQSGGAPEIDTTATEVNNDMESVYDTLSPFAEKVSSVWQTIVQFIAIITDNKDKVTIIHRFPSKFKLKSRQDLYAERKALQDSGAPSFAISAVDDELAEEIFTDDADGLFRYRIKKEHFPFPGKTASEIQSILTSTEVLKETIVLYNYFDVIFRDLERESKANGQSFYFLTVKERQTRIDEKVEEILAQIAEENRPAQPLNITVPGYDEEENPDDSNKS